MTATVDVNVLNFTGINQAFTIASSSFGFALTGPDATSTSVTAALGPISGMAQPGSTLIPDLPTLYSNSAVIVPANWSTYESVGFATSPYTVLAGNGTFGGSVVSGSNLVFFGGDSNASGIATVTFTFNAAPIATPEPATFFGLIRGAATVMFLRRRRVA